VDKDTFPADYRVTLGKKEVMKFPEMLKWLVPKGRCGNCYLKFEQKKLVCYHNIRNSLNPRI
jgi:hypothetical protein